MFNQLNRRNLKGIINSGIVCGILLIILFSNLASAAHTFDTSMTDGTATFTNTPNPRNLSYTAGVGATVMVLNVFTGTTTARAGGAPTFNSKTMTQVGTRQLTAGSPTEGAVEMWYLLLDPSSTGSAYTVSVPNTGSLLMRIHASTYKSATSASALDVFAQRPNTGTTEANPSQSITTTQNGCVLVDALFDGVTTVPTANSHTLIYKQDGGSYSANSQYYLQATAGPQALSWTVVADDFALITAAFKEVTLSNISGYITDGVTGLNLATVQINSDPVKTTTTNATGYYDFAGLFNGTYLINASLTGYINNSITRTINGADITDADIQLSQLLLFVPPTPSSLASSQGNFWINGTTQPIIYRTWAPTAGATYQSMLSTIQAQAA